MAYSGSVSVLVVSYNTKSLTLECLESVYKETKDCSFEIIVVDNASTDGSAAAVAEQFPEARLIVSASNLGFSAANNLAAKYGKGHYLLLLNPDTVILNRGIDRLVAFANARPDFGIFGGRTLLPDGTLDPSSCWRKPSTWNLFCRAIGLSGLRRDSAMLSADSYGGWVRDTPQEVDIVSGCFLLIRKGLWECLGGFDESYFMYGEDWDLCLRAKALGATCLFCPDAEIIHYGGASEPVRTDKIIRLFNTKVKLFRRHWSPVKAWILVEFLKVWALRSLLVNRIAGKCGYPDRRNEGDAWAQVWRRRKEWLCG